MSESRRELRISQLSWEAEGVVSLRLVDPSGAVLPSWEPGAHVVLHLPNGVSREYSLCSEPLDNTGWTVAVLREPASRGGSLFVHERLRVGEIIKVDGPRNNFRLESAGGYCMIAGGVGITPILPMVRKLHADGADWRLLYAGRSRKSMAFVSDLESLDRERVTFHADDLAGGQPDLTAAMDLLEPPTLVYCCGPEPLIRAVGDALGGDGPSSRAVQGAGGGTPPCGRRSRVRNHVRTLGGACQRASEY